MVSKLSLRSPRNSFTRAKQLAVLTISTLALIVAPLVVTGTAGATNSCVAASTCFWSGEDFTGNTLVMGNVGNNNQWIHVCDVQANVCPFHTASEGGSAVVWLYSKSTGEAECLVGTTGNDPDTAGVFGYAYIISNSSTCSSVPTPLP